MRISRNRVGSALLVATFMLAACSDEPRSLADYISALCAIPFRSAPPDEEPFLAENIGTMAKMMIDMGIRPSGDVDKDFVAMMTPHHQGAIEMAMSELRYGRNERLRRMAMEIIITQQQEIAAMRRAVDGPITRYVPSPEQLSSARLWSKSIHYHLTDVGTEP
jgi:DUF305 family protein family protein